jgi:antitoxin component YwqK of YwqJK toxin-antitoxin module
MIMLKKNLLCILLTAFTFSTFATNNFNNWPINRVFIVENDDSVDFHLIFDLKVIFEVLPNGQGHEYYESGNLRAEGALIKGKTTSHSVSYADKDTTEIIYSTEYVREGLWCVYFDSKDTILKSKGRFKHGVKDSTWIIYSRKGKPEYEYFFYKGQVMRKCRFDGRTGEKILMNEISKLNVFVLNNEGWMIILLLSLMGIRVLWNRIIYNMVNGYHYYPISKNFIDASGVTVYTMLIFWWFVKPKDSDKVVKYKRIGNWISVISSAFFIIGTILIAVTPSAYNY